MTHRRVGSRWALASVIAVGLTGLIGVSGTAHAGGGDFVFHKLYREDAFAEFVVHHGDCALERTVIQVTFHQDFYTEDPHVPGPRTSLFGLGISEFDCNDQFVANFSSPGGSGPFDIEPGLSSAKVHTTMQACQDFPSAGPCFDVDIRAYFKGVGDIDENQTHNVVNEPDCKIDELIITKTREARVWAKFAFTEPGGQPTVYEVSTANLSPNGASLSSDFERLFMQGDGFECTEH